MAKSPTPAKAGRHPSFTPERREAFIREFAKGSPLVTCCTAAGGIDPATYLDWLKVGEGRERAGRIVSEARREDAVRFALRIREVEESREVVMLEKCQATIEKAATEGFSKVKIRKVTRFDATGKQVHSETVEEIEKATPIWQASAWMKERRESEKWGRKDTLKADVKSQVVSVDLTSDDLSILRKHATPDEARRLRDEAPMDLITAILARARSGSEG